MTVVEQVSGRNEFSQTSAANSELTMILFVVLCIKNQITA
jgi:hypothetical protein